VLEHASHDTEAVTAPRVIALFGPTAVGKTAVGIALANALRAAGSDPVAVSADALQVYAGLEVLSGVASPAERAALEHRLVSCVPIDARFSVAEYAELAHAEIDGLLASGRLPLVIGGTGLYLRAALTELRLRPPPAEGVRERWEQELLARGVEALHAELARRAPWAAERIDPRDRHRVVRGLELYDLGELEQPGEESQLWTADVRHPTRLIGLCMEREALYARIHQRIAEMLEAGVVDEVRAAHAAGASETARQAVGFTELLAGDVETMERRTRNLVRRQMTWMRKLASVELVDVTDKAPDEVADNLLAREPWPAHH
jgi:tRNA dimethylallyltransferase